MPSTQRQLLVSPGPVAGEQAPARRGAGEPLDARHQEVGQAGRVGEVLGVGAAGAEVVGLDVLGEDGHGLAPAAAAPPGDHPDRLGRVGALDPEAVDPLVPAGPVAVHPGRGRGPGMVRPGRPGSWPRPRGPDRGGQPRPRAGTGPGHHHGQGHRDPQDHRAPGVVTLTRRSARAAARAAAQWRPATPRRRWRGTRPGGPGPGSRPARPRPGCRRRARRRPGHTAGRRGRAARCPARRPVVGPGPLDLEGQQLGHCRGGRGRPGRPADPEALQVGRGQVDAAAPVVLGHVADEVGELEGQAELAGVLAGGRRVGRSRIGAIMVPITAAEPSM